MTSPDLGEALLPVPAAVEKATGYRPHPTTTSRWTRKGVNGVRLECWRIGSSVRTTESAVRRFIAAQNGTGDSDTDEAEEVGTEAVPPAQMQHGRRAKRELASA